MKFLLVLSALVVLVTMASIGEDELLNNYEAILANDELREKIYNCLLDRVPCGDLQKLKDKILKLLHDKCINCTPEQKEKYDQLMKTVHEKYDNEFKEVMKKLANN